MTGPRTWDIGQFREYYRLCENIISPAAHDPILLLTYFSLTSCLFCTMWYRLRSNYLLLDRHPVSVTVYAIIIRLPTGAGVLNQTVYPSTLWTRATRRLFIHRHRSHWHLFSHPASVFLTHFFTVAFAHFFMSTTCPHDNNPRGRNMKGGGALALRIYPPSKTIFWQVLARAPEQIRLAGEILSIARCRRIQEKKIDTDFRNSFPGLSYRSPK